MIYLEDTIYIWTNALFENTAGEEGLSKTEFKKPFSTKESLATKEPFLVFNGKLYRQVGGVAMASPLGPTLANDFLVSCEKNWLRNGPSEL